MSDPVINQSVHARAQVQWRGHAQGKKVHARAVY